MVENSKFFFCIWKVSKNIENEIFDIKKLKNMKFETSIFCNSYNLPKVLASINKKIKNIKIRISKAKL